LLVLCDAIIRVDSNFVATPTINDSFDPSKASVKLSGILWTTYGLRLNYSLSNDTNLTQIEKVSLLVQEMIADNVTAPKWTIVFSPSTSAVANRMFAGIAHLLGVDHTGKLMYSLFRK